MAKPIEVNKVKRYQKRKKRRVFEATPQDWARWDAEAKLQGLSFSEFVRRSLHGACEVAIMRRATWPDELAGPGTITRGGTP